jgi:hypothetical protein
VEELGVDGGIILKEVVLMGVCTEFCSFRLGSTCELCRLYGIEP